MLNKFIIWICDNMQSENKCDLYDNQPEDNKKEYFYRSYF